MPRSCSSAIDFASSRQAPLRAGRVIQPPPFAGRTTEIETRDSITTGRFFAMGCPCEVLIGSTDNELTETIVATVRDEAWRIEQKWSRYLTGSVVDEINRRAGEAVTVDSETVQMIDFSTRRQAC